ncbi:MAG: hypothetical protein Q9191_007242, partial [Dirinaria sp. TL-2023a]
MARKQSNLPSKSVRQPRRHSAAGDEPQCSLLKLPLEIRIRIWELIMSFKEPVIVEHHSRQVQQEPIHLRSGKRVKLDIPSQEQRKLGAPFALAATCRQIYLEAAPVYYGLNTFELTPQNLVAFTESIGAANTEYITSIQWNDDLGALVRNIEQFQDLRRLVLVASCARDDLGDPFDLLSLGKIKESRPSLKVVVAPFDRLPCMLCQRSYELSDRIKEIR